MSYNPNIPQPTDFVSISQNDILNNFTQINTTFDEDHYTFDAAANNGKHKSVTLPEGAAIGTDPGEIALYSKDDGTRPALYLRQENDGTEIQMSGISPSAATNGYTFLPGGMLLQWNTSTINPSGSTTINFPTAFSGTAYSVVVTPLRDSSNTDIVYIKPGTIAAASFQVRNTAAGITQCCWMAVGPA